MTRTALTNRYAAMTLVVALACAACSQSTPDAGLGWTQWGGPTADFIAQSEPLLAVWPESGPAVIWERELGEGYSGIVVDAGRVYTMYRDEDREVVVALDAKNGRVEWEHRYVASPREGHVHQFGDGPRSTPLIVSEHIYTIGIAGSLRCLKKQNGALVWSRELWKEFRGNILNHGYSSSPIQYGDTIITLVGGRGASIMAFDMDDGDVVWQALDFENSYSTPRLLDIDGEQQLVAFMATELIGVDPGDGTLRWSYHHENQWRQNVNTPAMADPNHLFISSPQAGARGLRLTHTGDSVDVEEVWIERKIQFYHGSSVRQGDWVYGSTGTMAPAFLAAVNIRTGEVGWRERGFAKANCIVADGRLIILDEDGQLALAAASPEGLTVISTVKLFDKVAWTAPTVVGRTLYARDQQRIVALDLGADGGAES